MPTNAAGTGELRGPGAGHGRRLRRHSIWRLAAVSLPWSSTAGAPLRAATPSLPLDGSQGSSSLDSPSLEILAQYRVEPDADGDGFGDETQDKCPTKRQDPGRLREEVQEEEAQGQEGGGVSQEEKVQEAEEEVAARRG